MVLRAQQVIESEFLGAKCDLEFLLEDFIVTLPGNGLEEDLNSGFHWYAPHVGATALATLPFPRKI